VAAGELDRALRIWRPAPGLALTRLDELRSGADDARAIAARAGLETTRRVSGGHAVVAGPGSLCVGVGEPAVAFEGTQERYESLGAALIGAFAAVGIDAQRGELPGEWCPGAWSIRSGKVKLAGLAQRAVKGAAWAEAVVRLEPDPDGDRVLVDVYSALELPLDPATLGSVAELADREVSFDEIAQGLVERLSIPP
jgi:lipoate-protein ligase A